MRRLLTAGRPLIIAHGAGNDRRQLLAALRAGVDMVEVDVWRHRGRLVARHEHGLGFLPLVYDKWYVKVALGRPLTLADVMLIAKGSTRLLLDLKGDGDDFLTDLLALIQDQGLVQEVAVSSQRWKLLEQARERLPELAVCYTIDSRGQLAALKDLLAGGRAPPAVSIRHLHLSQGLIRVLKGNDVAILAWTVDEPGRAQELVGWGVDGIISDSLPLLLSLKGAAAS